MASRICLAHARLEDGPRAGQDGAAADDGAGVAVATRMHLSLEFPKGGGAVHPDNASRHNRPCSEPTRRR